MGHVTSPDGTTIAFACRRTGDPVLLVHGDDRQLGELALVVASPIAYSWVGRRPRGSRQGCADPHRSNA